MLARALVDLLKASSRIRCRLLIALQPCATADVVIELDAEAVSNSDAKRVLRALVVAAAVRLLKPAPLARPCRVSLTRSRFRSLREAARRFARAMHSFAAREDQTVQRRSRSSSSPAGAHPGRDEALGHGKPF